MYTYYVNKNTLLQLILEQTEFTLSNDREISNCATAVTRQQPINSNQGMVFSVRPLLRRYKHSHLAAAVSW
jgi:hypothetical protein